jgi:hypothetical protein
MEIFPEMRPDLWDDDSELIWADEEELLAGEVFADDPDDKNKQVYVNLIARSDGLFEVRVYDCDAGGPNVYWIDELYDNEAEARVSYEGRVKETDLNTPFYVRKVWDRGDDELPYTINENSVG